MVVSREERIEDIIKLRAPFVRDVQVIQSELQKRAQVLRELEELQARIMKNGPTIMVESVKDLQFSLLRKHVEEAMQDLEKPKSRFSRKTLNIGVIGRARQGKSRLLQSLSGLTSEVIPSGSAGHCTGVRSLILHSSSQKGAEIFFYSEQEFLDEVLAPYYEKLGLGSAPLSLSLFTSTPLPPLPTGGVQMSKPTRVGEMYRHLQEYKNNIGVYGPFINLPPQRIPLSQVREYVAQDSVDGRQSFFKYLAVREARIYCDFKHEDVGQIALVDMPGLGDTGVGAEERLVAALGEHLDVVLFVLMPSPTGANLNDVDFDLYDLTYQALPGIPIERWSFMILNHTNPGRVKQESTAPTGPLVGDNYRNCERISQMIQSGSTGAGSRSIRVVNCLIADCSNANDARELVLEETLHYLVQNIAQLDAQYMSSWQQKLANLYQRIRDEVGKAVNRLSANQISSQDDIQFERLFNELWGDLTSAANTLIDSLEVKSSAPNRTFTDYFRRVFEQCRRDTGLPSKEEIKVRRDDQRSYLNALNNALNDMRTHLTYHFIDMDDKLKITMDEVKLNVAELFLNRGKLASLLAGRPPQEFFHIMAADHLSLHSRLQKTFETFDSYELALRGFFQSRLRQNLTRMIPDKANVQLLPDRLTPEGVIEQLRLIQAETVTEIEKKLMLFVDEPSQAAFAVVHEFIDQTFYSKNVKDHWRGFYHPRKAQIWKHEFAQSAKSEAFQREWQEITKRASAVVNGSPLGYVRTM